MCRLDSHLDYIPNYIKQNTKKISDIIFEYNKEIIDVTSDIVAIFYKPQIAYYEANGLEGLIAYQRTLKYIKEKGLWHRRCEKIRYCKYGKGICKGTF